MKRIISVLLLGVAMFTLAFSNPALADGDVAAGARIFTANCTQCHARGKNLVNPKKTLSQADLTANGKYSVDAIIAQVTAGAAKAGMPSFKRLGDVKIANVAAYVYDQAGKGWKK